MSKSRNVYPTWWLLSHMLSHAVAVALNRILLVSSRTMMASNPNLSAVPDRCHVTSSTSLSRCNEPGKSRFSAAFHTCGMELEIHSSRLIGAISRVASRECSQTRDLGSRGLSRSERNGMNGALNRPAFEEQQNLASGRERQSPRYTNFFPEVKRLSSRKRTEGGCREEGSVVSQGRSGRATLGASGRQQLSRAHELHCTWIGVMNDEIESLRRQVPPRILLVDGGRGPESQREGRKGESSRRGKAQARRASSGERDGIGSSQPKGMDAGQGHRGSQRAG